MVTQCFSFDQALDLVKTLGQTIGGFMLLAAVIHGVLSSK